MFQQFDFQNSFIIKKTSLTFQGQMFYTGAPVGQTDQELKISKNFHQTFILLLIKHFNVRF